MKKLVFVATALVGTMLLADDRVPSRFVVHEWEKHLFYRGLASLGRFAEPNLRRALAQATDPEVKGRCEQLLEQLMPAR